MPTPTNLTRTIGLLYAYQQADIDQLADDLLDQRKRAWSQALRDVGREHGVTVPPRPPSGEDLRELRRMAREDARSIARTWNRDAQRQIQRIYDANPRSNRYAYARNMERWAEERGRWKNVQIALNSETTTHDYARRRFYELNNAGARGYVLQGPAPTCDICGTAFGAGIVSRAYINAHTMPAHLNCPHWWGAVAPEQLGNDGVWMG